MQTLDCKILQDKSIQLKVLRLDEVHPVISGNKLFKLHYFIANTAQQPIVTFGGAYSNHLVATAYACQQKQMECIGIVRGEKPIRMSHTLQHCMAYGMQLHFISREDYDKKDTDSYSAYLNKKYPHCTIIPEGGYALPGAKGAAHIHQYIDAECTHICCAIGTATTLAGLLLHRQPHQKIIGFPVLKGMTDIEERIRFLTEGRVANNAWHIEPGYHFGGYAKKNAQLIQFMNELYATQQLPTDFVYTAKMMYGVMDCIKNDIFLPGSKICCIHTGGLQGNLSLPNGTLTF